MSRLLSALTSGHALMPYLTASDPSSDSFLDAALGAIDGGAAALEVGIPFSDPVADGPVIQQAHQRALAAGGGVAATLELVRSLRAASGVPLVLFTYLNPLIAYGMEPFAADALAAGADGVLVLDLPPEEEPGWFEFLAGRGLDPILLDSPNTSAQRFGRVARLARGFVYVVSRAGITGTHAGASEGLELRLARLRSLCPLPMAVGFGVRTHRDVAAIWKDAECAVVGSALVDALAACPLTERRETARRFVAGLLRCQNGSDVSKEMTP